MKMEASIFFDSYLPLALRRALDYAGEEGFVASLPQLLRARVNADYGNIIWNTWFNPYTEESLVTTPQGNRVIVTIHGGGIFASPERYEKLFRASTDRSSELGFTGLFAGKLSKREAHEALQGQMPDGIEIPVYSFDEFKRGIDKVPRRYGVVTDFETARNSACGYVSFDTLKGDPVMIVRAGGVEAAAAYLDKAKARNNTSKMGSWHPFRNVDTPDQPQTRVPNLAGNQGGVGSEEDDGHLHGYDSDFGIGGDNYIHNTSMINVARYVAVAPRDPTMGVRNLPFTP
ncbi:MAG: hypothetical protein OEO82_10095 [Gammaproteobacteria bacterium]|nr:hypothetical protein [Gammaproteobacteria bacterium]